MVRVPLSWSLSFVEAFMLSGAWYPSKFTRSVNRSPLVRFFFLCDFVEEVIVIFQALFCISSMKAAKFINRKDLLKADLLGSLFNCNILLHVDGTILSPERKL